MKTGFLVAILSASMALGVFSSHWVSADGRSYGYNDELHVEDACRSWARMSHRTVDCMHAWWDNSPSVGGGRFIGSTHGVENFCADWGTVVAHIDVKNRGDLHYHMDENKKYRSYIS